MWVYFPLQNSLCGNLYTYSQDEVIVLKYTWRHCWHHPCYLIPMPRRSIYLEVGEWQPALYKPHAQYILIAVTTPRGTTTLSQFKARFSGAKQFWDESQECLQMSYAGWRGLQIFTSKWKAKGGMSMTKNIMNGIGCGMNGMWVGGIYSTLFSEKFLNSALWFYGNSLNLEHVRAKALWSVRLVLCELLCLWTFSCRVVFTSRPSTGTYPAAYRQALSGFLADRR